MQMLLRTLDWNQNPYFRELLIGLDECKFKQVPDDIAEDIGLYTELPRTSKPNEDAHNIQRDRARHSKSGKCGRKRGYHSLTSSRILEDGSLP
jgi:hypothetical protein